MVKDKKTGEFIHAKRRASQRFGFTLTEKLHNQIIQKIKSKQVKLIAKPSNRTRIYEIELDLNNWASDNPTLKFRIVYDKDREQVVTFLFIDKFNH